MATALEIEVQAIRSQLNSLSTLVQALTDKMDGTASAPTVRNVMTALQEDIITLQDRTTSLEAQVEILNDLISEE